MISIYFTTKSKINKEYMCLALRFLKEARLLNYWKMYVYKSFNIHPRRLLEKHWSSVNYIDDIFGYTSFTGFICRKMFNGEERRPYCSIYVLFGYWLKLNKYDFTLSPQCEASTDFLFKKEDPLKRGINFDYKRRKINIDWNLFYLPSNYDFFKGHKKYHQ